MAEEGKENSGITRRGFFKKVGKTGLKVGAALASGTTLASILSACAPGEAEKKSQSVDYFKGTVLLGPDVNLRADPHVSPKGDPPNTILRKSEDRNQIIPVKNPLLVEGGSYLAQGRRERWLLFSYDNKKAYAAFNIPEVQVKEGGTYATCSQINEKDKTFYRDEKGQEITIGVVVRPQTKK